MVGSKGQKEESRIRWSTEEKRNQGDWRRKVESERDDEIIWIRER